MTKFAWIVCAFSIVALGCNSSGDGDGPDGDRSDDSDSGPEGGPGDEIFEVQWGPLDIGPGVENTQCVVKEMDNTTLIRVHELHNVLKATSHHLIVYKVANDTPLADTPYDCDPFVDTFDIDAGSPLMVTQKADDRLILPSGVAFTLEPKQRIRLELHYINATDTLQEAVTATARMITISEDNFQHEADFLFIGNPEIEIPPMSTHTVGPTYFPLPADLADSKFFAVTGHEHQWGTDVRVATTPAADGNDTMVYQLENFRWDEPETVMHDPTFTVPEGGGFRFSCDYNNRSANTVGFGESAGDEMCFFWAYYYPSKGARVCVHSDEYNIDLCCPGSNLCALIEGQL